MNTKSIVIALAIAAGTSFAGATQAADITTLETV